MKTYFKTFGKLCRFQYPQPLGCDLMFHFFIALLLLSSFSFAQNTVHNINDIEIVESIPVETSLDNADIRNAHEVWLEMINNAKQTLDIEQFYISNEPGKLLEDVLYAIYKAADRGVKVRVIVDSKMYKTYPQSVDSLNSYPNIEARRVNFGTIAGGIQHAKFFIIDNREIFVGSQNFDWRALEHIHELGLRINNKEIAEVYSAVFNYDWEASADTSVRNLKFTQGIKTKFPVNVAVNKKEKASITPTCSPIGFIPNSNLWDETQIVQLIEKAKKSLVLQFLAYSPYERRGGNYTIIDDAIRRAAKRGVNVKMIVADWEKSSGGVKALKELSAIKNIQIAFTVIPEWTGGYISFARVEHCKFIVADETNFWLGTSNCEKNYFYATRNVGILCSNKTLSKKLSSIFYKSWNSPYKELITPAGEYKPREHGEKK